MIGRMRLALCLLLTGCDGLLGLLPIQPLADAGPDAMRDAPADGPPPCGRFTTLTQVPRVAGPVFVSDFSVAADELNGAVFGKLDSTSKPQVLLLARVGITDPWDLDQADSLPSEWSSPRMAAADDVFAAQPQLGSTPPPYDIVETRLQSGVWMPATLVDQGAGYDAFPKGYANVNGIPTVVEIEVRSGANNLLLFRTYDAGTMQWLPQAQNQVNAAGNTSSGALSPDGRTFVYAQSPTGTTTGSDLYVSFRSDPSGELPAGTKIQLPGTDSEELDPWLVDNSCSHLYFRRDSTLFIATP
jgi:hypothetical protein